MRVMQWGKAMQPTNEEYLERAVECAVLAEEASDPLLKNAFLKLSQTWQKLATDQDQATAEPNPEQPAFEVSYP